MNLDWKHWLFSHLIWVVGITILVISGYEYLGQQRTLAAADARAQAAEATVSVLQKQIADRDGQISGLQASQVARDKQTQAQISSLAKAIANVKTPEQVVQALPVVTDLPLNAHTILNSPQIAVDAEPLFTGLAACKQQSLEITACKLDLFDEKKVADSLVQNGNDQRAIIAQKQAELDGYKRAAGHRGFFSKVWSVTQKIGLLGIGTLAGKML